MTSGREWLAATDFEFSYRVWVFAAIFFGSFQLYAVDHVMAAAAIAGWLSRSGLHVTTGMVIVAGVALAFLAALLRTWAAAYMRTEVVHDAQVHDTRLVADGPYRYVRNPLYLGTTLLGVGFALVASRLGAVVMIVLLVVFHDRLVRREERALRATQGASYREYLAKVPRFVPSLWPRVPAGGMRPRWGQAFGGEIFMWGFAAAYLVLAVTGNGRVMTWSCIALVALTVLLRRWMVARRLAQ